MSLVLASAPVHGFSRLQFPAQAHALCSAVLSIAFAEAENAGCVRTLSFSGNVATQFRHFKLERL